MPTAIAGFIEDVYADSERLTSAFPSAFHCEEKGVCGLEFVALRFFFPPQPLEEELFRVTFGCRKFGVAGCVAVP